MKIIALICANNMGKDSAYLRVFTLNDGIYLILWSIHGGRGGDKLLECLI